jgi:hypothetical protein
MPRRGLVALEVDAAGQEETGDTDGGETAAGAGQVVLGEVGEDLAPVVAGSDPDVLVLLVDLECRQVGHDEERTIVDVVGALWSDMLAYSATIGVLRR